MTDIRDELGRPIQLTDEFGNPVQLTDEHGVPIHLTGIATTVGSSSTPHDHHMTIGSELQNKMSTHDDQLATDQTTIGPETHGGTHFAPTPIDYVKHGAAAAVTGCGAPGTHTQPGDDKKPLERSSSSSPSSSEDDGEGGRRKKKKGFVQKIKEKLPGHGDKDKAAAHSPGTDTNTKISTTGVDQEHQKKGFFDKIKDKLPGAHH